MGTAVSYALQEGGGSPELPPHLAAMAEVRSTTVIDLSTLRLRFTERASRRQLQPEDAKRLVLAWRAARARRDEEVGPLWGYLGWTPEELARFQATGVCPIGG